MLSHLVLNNLGPEIKVQVRHSKTAKRIIIKIKNNVIELVLPHSRSIDKIIQDGYKFLLEKEFWIRNKLYHQSQSDINFDKETIPIFGEFYKLLYIDDQQQNVLMQDNAITVYSNPLLQTSTLIKFLKKKLLLKITAEVNSLAQYFDKKVAEIKIVNNKSRWGSCSSKGVLRFSWRLVFAPENIINYVIIHEVCHLAEMNHSKSFWLLVKKFYPDYKSAIFWLKKNSSRLYKYLN